MEHSLEYFRESSSAGFMYFTRVWQTRWEQMHRHRAAFIISLYVDVSAKVYLSGHRTDRFFPLFPFFPFLGGCSVSKGKQCNAALIAPIAANWWKIRECSIRRNETRNTFIVSNEFYWPRFESDPNTRRFFPLHDVKLILERDRENTTLRNRVKLLVSFWF